MIIQSNINSRQEYNIILHLDCRIFGTPCKMVLYKPGKKCLKFMRKKIYKIYLERNA